MKGRGGLRCGAVGGGMSFIEFEPPGARGRGPGRPRSTTLLTPNTTNPQVPHPSSGVQKQKGKTGAATMVSGAEEMWTDGLGATGLNPQ